MSIRLDRAIKDFIQAIKDYDNSSTSPRDAQGEVLRIDPDGTAWVHFPGGVDETPVRLTINAEPGDIITARLSGGRAWITGNQTSPPTDDKAANIARRVANLAGNIARRASKAAAEAKEKADSAMEKSLENAEFMATAVLRIDSDIEGLQEQIDGNITSWFYAVDPTLSNMPASEWIEEGTEAVHLGDLYYNTESGYAWRWMYDGDEDEYAWMRITDVDVVKALADAAKAQDTADSKRRVFVAQPAPPYDIGDLWVQGSSGDILRCSHARVTGESYVASDWVKASKYTDDTVAQQALQSANGKNTIYHSASAPIGNNFKVGDTWFDTDDDNKIYKWSGSTWSPVLLGDDAIDSISANKITAGEIDASQITVSNLDAGNITSGTLDTARLNVSGIITSGNIATESDLPTKVSDLTNDSGFQNASQVDSIVTGKGYQTASQVDGIVIGKGYQTASQVNTAVANGVAGKADKTDAVLEQQRIYKSVASGGSASATTTWITETSDVQNTWTTKRPTYSSSYPVLYTAIQRKKVSGTVSCTTPLKDDTLTVIDGGHITTGTIDANRINITDLIQVGNIATDSDLPTKVSDLNNDSGFVTADGIVMRNLVKNGYWDADFKNNIKSWTKESSAIIDYDASTDLYKISYSSNTAYGLYQDIAVESGVPYVISASVGSNFHLGIGTSGYPDDSGGWSTAPDGRKYKIFNSRSTNMRVYAYAKADTCYINRIKVEKGSTYTGWYDDNTKDLSSKYLKFDTTNGLDIGYSGTNAKVNIDGQNVNIYNSNGYIGNVLYPNGMRVMDGQGGSTPVFEVYANSNWSSYAKSGSASFQSAYSPAPYIADISCNGTVVGVASVWAQNQQGTDISDYCYWKYISSSNKIQVYISRDYSGPTPATAHANYWVQTPSRAYVGVNPSNPSNYLFVVGNGTASHPSNALSVDGFGNLAAKGYANFDRGVIASTSIGARSYLDVDVNFNKTFESVPIVVATLCSSSTAYQIGNVSCSVLANSITKKKFTLRLFNADTTSRSPAVYWMATDAK